MGGADSNSEGPISRPALLMGMRSASRPILQPPRVRTCRTRATWLPRSQPRSARLRRRAASQLRRRDRARRAQPHNPHGVRLAVGLRVRPSRLVQLAERHQAEMPRRQTSFPARRDANASTSTGTCGSMRTEASSARGPQQGWPLRPQDEAEQSAPFGGISSISPALKARGATILKERRFPSGRTHGFGRPS